MEEVSGKKRSFVPIVIAAMSVVIISLVTVIFVISSREEQAAPVVKVQPTVIKGTVMNEDNALEVLEEINRPAIDARYRVNMTTTWVFKDGETPSESAFVANKETNKRTVYFQVIIEETEELVYTSPYIPVGSELTDFALDVDLDKGEYDAIVKYVLVDDENNDLTSVSMGVDLIVEG